MTREEFQGQYVRLCKGFKYDATPEQAEALYRKLGHHAVQDWSEAVSTLLCAPRYPLLDAVLSALESAQAHRKSVQLQQDKRVALAVTQKIDASETEIPKALFMSVRLYARRAQIRAQLQWLKQHPTWQNERRYFDRNFLVEEAELTSEIVTLSESLTADQNARLIRKYESG